MDLASIVLTRIDQRLVHGQVGSSWGNAINVDTLVVVDDETAENVLAMKLMESVARASSKRIRFYNIESFIETYFNTESTQKLFLVVISPIVAKKLVENHIPIHSINVGNLHYSKGKIPLNRKVYLDDEEIEAFNYLTDQGIEVFYQDVPGAIIEKIHHLEKKGKFIANQKVLTNSPVS